MPARVSHGVLKIVVILVLSSMGQSCSHARQTSNAEEAKAAPPPADIPACNGSGLSAGRTPSQVNLHPHYVTLSWNAAVPVSKSPRDAIRGYYVYRSLTSETYGESNRISEMPVKGTRCIDSNVAAQGTYFYVVRAVTEGGKQSGSSHEIKAVVPSP
ncbi:MAG: fibronectin type III domain-containing protein [Candidatus Sulfotelmatobacter sp.]